MPEVIEAEMIRAAGVGAVEKRAVRVFVHHANPFAADALSIGLAMNET